MTAMAVLLAILFVGLTVFAVQFGLRPSEEGGPSVVALAAQTAFGEGSVLFVTFAASTALILFLAANTSFNAFPRLAAILAEDGYMPRQFSFRGDRLAYSWGIALLAGVAFGLLWIFDGDTHALIPLYSVGVFLCFTVSQVGMVRHWLTTRDAGWRWRLVVNAAGGVLTAVVLGVVVFEKFEDGAYLIVIMVPLLVAMMQFIHAQYARSARELAVHPDLVVAAPHREERVVVPIPGVNRAVVQAINVARSIDDDVRAVFISDDQARAVEVALRVRASRPGRAASRRGLALSSTGRAAAGLPRRPGCGVAAGQGGADHVRGDPGIRGPQLVGADPVQPGRQTPAGDAPWSTAHGRCQRAIPARGPRAVRDGHERVGASARLNSPRVGLGQVPPDLDRVRWSAASRLVGGAVVSWPAMPDSAMPAFRRAVVALNGGPSDARIVRLAAEHAARTKAELIAVHVVEIDWTLPLDADLGARSEEVQRVLDIAETIAEESRVRLEPVLLQARDVGAAIVDEAVERQADLLIVGLPYRKRFGGEFAIGRTIPYVLQNAPSAVWVVRDPISEGPA